MSRPLWPLRLPRRIRANEILDEPDVDPAAMDRSLRSVARVNILLGGIRSLRLHLDPLLDVRPELSLLDVGVGNGEVSDRLARHAAARGGRLRWVGLDLHPAALAASRAVTGSPDGPVGLVRADAVTLPFRDGSFDVAVATLTLHHFDEEGSVRVLSEMARVSRLAVLVSDLERHPLHYLGSRVLAATWWRGDPITRHDGPVSVLRSFTADELRGLARMASLHSVKVRRHLPFRLVLVGRP